MILTIIAVCLFFIALPWMLGTAALVLLALASIPKWFWQLTLAIVGFLVFIAIQH
jgi:hypothetical protein